MNGPDPVLSQVYGTKVAGAEARLPVQVMAAMHLMQAGGARLSRLRAQAEMMNEQARAIEMGRMQPVAANLSHTQAPVFISPSGLGPFGYPVPVGMDGGMVRLASAKRAGRGMAQKVAGVGKTLKSVATKGTIAGGLAVGGAGLAAAKGLDFAQDHVLDDGPNSRAGALVPLSKFGGIGPVPTSAFGAIGTAAKDLGGRFLTWGKKGLAKTTAGNLAAGGALAAGTLGVSAAGKKGIEVMSTEAKPYLHVKGFEPSKSVSPWGYSVPAAPRY